MERGKRIELSALAWKAKVLPLYEPRIIHDILLILLYTICQGESDLTYSSSSGGFASGDVLGFFLDHWL